MRLTGLARLTRRTGVTGCTRMTAGRTGLLAVESLRRAGRLLLLLLCRAAGRADRPVAARRGRLLRSAVRRRSHRRPTLRLSRARSLALSLTGVVAGAGSGRVGTERFRRAVHLRETGVLPVEPPVLSQTGAARVGRRRWRPVLALLTTRTGWAGRRVVTGLRMRARLAGRTRLYGLHRLDRLHRLTLVTGLALLPRVVRRNRLALLARVTLRTWLALLESARLRLVRRYIRGRRMRKEVVAAAFAEGRLGLALGSALRAGLALRLRTGSGRSRSARSRIAITLLLRSGGRPGTVRSRSGRSGPARAGVCRSPAAAQPQEAREVREARSRQDRVQQDRVRQVPDSRSPAAAEPREVRGLRARPERQAVPGSRSRPREPAARVAAGQHRPARRMRRPCGDRRPRTSRRNPTGVRSGRSACRRFPLSYSRTFGTCGTSSRVPLLLHANRLRGPRLERHLVGLRDLRLQSHSTCRGVDHVHHLRKQFRSIRVSGLARELHGPSQFGRCAVDITRLARSSPCWMTWASSA